MTGDEVGAALARAGVDVDAQRARGLAAYLELVLEENLRQNLTALRTEQMFLSGIVDAALCFAAAGRPSGRLIDVGSGSGLPAVPWLVLGQWRAATLVEAERRKCAFLESALRALDLAGEVVWGRAEELAHGRLRESADVVTAQAVASAPIALEICAGLTRVGGRVVLPKGPNCGPEASAAVPVAQRMGMEVLGPEAYTLPDAVERVVLLYRKVRPSPAGRPAAYARLRQEFSPLRTKAAQRDGQRGGE